MNCPNCGAANAADARYCSACGTRFPATPEAAPEPYTTIDLDRVGPADWVAFGGTVVLFIALLLPWYGWTTVFGWVTVSALGMGSGGWRFLILLDCVLVLLYLFFRTMAPRGFRLPLPHWQLLTVLTGLNLLLTALTFLVRPGNGVIGNGAGLEYGSYVGVAAAVAAVVGAVLRRGEPELRDAASARRTGREGDGGHLRVGGPQAGADGVTGAGDVGDARREGDVGHLPGGGTPAGADRSEALSEQGSDATTAPPPPAGPDRPGTGHPGG